MAKLTIDGIPVEVPDGTVLLEACKAVGIDVPNFCYYPKLALLGACRMCLVEIKAGPMPPAALAKPQASCTTTVRGDGWEILTNSPKVEKLRKGMLEFLLLNHSLTCPTCDMGGECELQDTTWRYGPGVSRLKDPKAYRKIENLGPFLDLNMQRCVQCQRCVRYCDEVMGNNALGMEHRGSATQIMGFPGEDLDCVLCGNCIEVCPVGALTSDQFDTKARQWDRVETTTICTYCSDGCSMRLDAKVPSGTINTQSLNLVADRYSLKLYKDRGQVLRARGFVDSGILIEEYKGNNEEFLCHKGRFGFHIVNHKDRLTTPLVKKDGALQPATWAEALKAVAEGFKRILSESGPDALGGIASEKTTNEENYLFQKFIRAVFGTNNVDHRLSVKDFRTETPPGSRQLTVGDLFGSRSILLIGPGVTEENPLVESRIRLAVRRNRASLAVGGSRKSLITKEAGSYLRCKPGGEAALSCAYAAALIPAREAALKAEVDRTQAALEPAALERATQGGRIPLEAVTKTAQGAADKAKAALDAYSIPDELKNLFAKLPLEKSAEIAGVPAEKIAAAVKPIAGSPATHVILGQDLMKAPGGREATQILRAVCRAFGWPDPAELLEHNNSRGARDVGALPDLLPGYQPVSDEAARDAISEVWGAPVPGKIGLNAHQIFQNAATGQIKGLYVMGANPIVTFAGGDLAKRALEKLDFLVVQDAFLSETAQLADVVLPAALFAEKEGTFTNWEGRAQHVRPSVAPPGDARSDDEIIIDIAREMGSGWRDQSWESVLEEIGRVGGIYAGIAKSDLDTVKGEGVIWPRKNGIDSTAPLNLPDFSELQPDADYPIFLYWGVDAYHHGSLTHWDEGPMTAEAFAYVKVNPADARSLDVSEGDGVLVQSARYKIELPCKITDDVAPGQIFAPTTFPESPVNLLLDSGRILERVRLSKGAPRLASEWASATKQKAGAAG